MWKMREPAILHHMCVPVNEAEERDSSVTSTATELSGAARVSHVRCPRVLILRSAEWDNNG